MGNEGAVPDSCLFFLLGWVALSRLDVMLSGPIVALLSHVSLMSLRGGKALGGYRR